MEQKVQRAPGELGLKSTGLSLARQGCNCHSLPRLSRRCKELSSAGSAKGGNTKCKTRFKVVLVKLSRYFTGMLCGCCTRCCKALD